MLLNAVLGWPSTMSSNLAGPVPARMASLAVFHDTANASAIRGQRVSDGLCKRGWDDLKEIDCG